MPKGPAKLGQDIIKVEITGSRVNERVFAYGKLICPGPTKIGRKTEKLRQEVVEIMSVDCIKSDMEIPR